MVNGEIFLAIGDWNDNVDVDETEPLFHNLCQHPLGRFCIRLQEYAKWGWQVFL